MERKKLSQRDVADLLQWSHSKVAKILTGRVELRVDDLESLCFAVGISIVEAVRDRGLEFCAEMTPTELRALEQLRRATEPTRNAILQLLDVKTKTALPERYAAPMTSKRPKHR